MRQRNQRGNKMAQSQKTKDAESWIRERDNARSEIAAANSLIESYEMLTGSYRKEMAECRATIRRATTWLAVVEKKIAA